MERGAKSLADDLGMDRGVVPSRAAASLRSAETNPSDPRDLSAISGRANSPAHLSLHILLKRGGYEVALAAFCGRGYFFFFGSPFPNCREVEFKFSSSYPYGAISGRTNSRYLFSSSPAASRGTAAAFLFAFFFKHSF